MDNFAIHENFRTFMNLRSIKDEESRNTKIEVLSVCTLVSLLASFLVYVDIIPAKKVKKSDQI